MKRRTAATSEVAAELGLAPATLQKYAREGRIPFDITPGGHRRFNTEEVRASLASSESAVNVGATSAETTSSDAPATAVILTALDVEYDAVRAHLKNLRARRVSGGTRFEVGEFSGDFLDWHVAVAEIGEGNVGAAIEAEKAISYFDPDLILFVGVAGGFKDDLRHGDVVVASKVYDYHGGKAAEDFYARPMAFPIVHSLEQLVRKVRRGRWFESSTHEVSAEGPSVLLKPIAAGQVVVASRKSQIAEQIRKHYNDTTAVDMESVGMLMAAQRADRPAAVIRSISDLLDDKTSKSDITLQPLASRNAAAFAFALLRSVEPEDLREGATPAVHIPPPSDLFARIPPNVVAELERARPHSPADADALLRRLASEAEPPVELVNRLVDDLPEWLEHSTSPRLWTAIGEFAAAHNAAEAAVNGFVRASELGDPEAPKWMARAALSAASQDQYERARELLARARELAGGSHPFVNVIQAAFEVADSGDVSRASRVLEAAEAHGGDDSVVEMMRGHALFMLKRRADALAVYEAALEDYPAHTAAALGAAEVLFARCAMDESESPVRDLERARELALQARDLRRGWRGDSAEAAALAAKIAIYSGDLDSVLKIALTPPEGEATQAESEHPEVLSQASRAFLFKGDAQRALELAEKIPDEVERELAQAECFRYIPDSDDLAQGAYERALEAAADDSQRVQAYFGLAKLGKWPLPGVERLAEQDPEVVDMIAAEADLAQGNTTAAIKRYREWWKQSPRALEGLVNVYLDNDRVDEAVDALRDGAGRHRNPELRVRAARILVSAKRYEDAEAEAKRAMDALPAGSRQHRELRKLRVQLAAWLDRWPEVEEQARAGLDEGIDIPDMRWALVVAQYNRRRPEDALEEMVREPALEPRDEIEAGLAIQLYRLGSRTPDDVRRVLELADRFAASEEVSAAAFIAAIEMSLDTEISASLLGRLRTFQSDFFERFPDSDYIRRFQADDAEAMVGKLIEHLEETLAPGARHYEEITQEVISGSRPYGFISVVAGKPYAEALIKRAAGFLPISSANTEIAVLEREAAKHALDGPVVAETSALHTLELLRLDPKKLLANFSRILVPAEVLDDAIAAREVLNLRSTGMMGWDARSNRPTLTEVDEEQAEALANKAERLVSRVRECDIVTSRPRKAQGQEIPEAARPWLVPIEMAKERDLPLLSDDFVLRAAARSEGVAAFGTLDLVTVLVDDGELKEEDLKAVLMDLRWNYAADLPLDEEQILAISAEDEWKPGPAAAVLTRPALWEDPISALSFYNKCISGVLAHEESLLPGWCAAAVLGFGRNWPPAIVTRRAGRVLAHTVLMSSVVSGELKVNLFSPLLAASRQVAQSLGGGDPLPAAVESLREMLEATVGAANTPQVFAKLVDGLDDVDRVAALRVFLRLPRT
jgi:nucleoside phosphorylase/tetratricopeptide (TPR) repeat protein